MCGTLSPFPPKRTTSPGRSPSPSTPGDSWEPSKITCSATQTPRKGLPDRTASPLLIGREIHLRTDLLQRPRDGERIPRIVIDDRYVQASQHAQSIIPFVDALPDVRGAMPSLRVTASALTPDSNLWCAFSP